MNTFGCTNETIAHSLPRSSSNGYYHRNPNHFTFNQFATDTKRVHLISSDLWEAITGERQTPSGICQILDSSVPMSNTPNSISLQSMEYVLMARDRQGSRILQKKLDESTPQDRTTIFNSLYPQLSELVYDTSGNFVIQKLCEYLTPEQQQRMLNFFLENIQIIIDNPNGCRVLQKFIEFTTKPNISSIFDAVKPSFIPLCFSQNGNHIVQRFIESLPDRTNEIIEAIEPHLFNLVVDNCGCRVIQRLFDRCPIDELENLVQEVLKCPEKLATNQYGNYVVQNILAAGKKEHISALIKSFRGHFYEFSIHKFASNVIEKCIRDATKDEQMEIFVEIIGDENHFLKDRILRMISDQFGNYVIQRIIENGSESMQNVIYEVVYDNFDDLNGNYAKHVIAKLEKMGFDF
ncbi:Pumilio-family RNA binding repeat containing protein [Histomonas meleagridis]|uniref:Pumilio-family RNA binding repeat containing protein n=1 Tax=Histomonas meleagridis TaxID=135588 RepID=UPI0035593F8C|nr:Pumilio-family RNA binding repeat containing protein [Histomonas meleagridis]KAH0796575.1 Pumilio-family RNA binding repeat containing protein [Histomonas meleagridis]